MKRCSQLLLLASLLFFSSTCMADEFEVFSENLTVQPYMQSAYGYAFFPKIGAGGVIVGGSYGRGEVYAMGKLRGTAVMVKTSFGLQAGGGSYSELIFFENEEAYEKFIAGQMDFSFNATAVAPKAAAAMSSGSKGDFATTGTDRQDGHQRVKGYQNGVRVFVHVTGGLQAGMSVANQKVKFTPITE